MKRTLSYSVILGIAMILCAALNFEHLTFSEMIEKGWTPIQIGAGAGILGVALMFALDDIIGDVDEPPWKDIFGFWFGGAIGGALIATSETMLGWALWQMWYLATK